MNLTESFKWQLKAAEKKAMDANAELLHMKITTLQRVSEAEILEAIVGNPYLYLFYIVAVEKGKFQVAILDHLSRRLSFTHEELREVFPDCRRDIWACIENYLCGLYDFDLAFRIEDVFIDLVDNETDYDNDWRYSDVYGIVPSFRFFAKRCLEVFRKNEDAIMQSLEEYI